MRNIYTVKVMLFKLITISLLIMFYSSVSAQDEISSQRSIELNNLLIQDCGSCHGMTMKGGLGPALTPDALKNKPREMVEVTIANGRPGTPMPPWNKILTSQEINWMVDKLYSGVKQ